MVLLNLENVNWEVVEKGKSGKHVMVGLSVFLYQSSDSVGVIYILHMYLLFVLWQECDILIFSVRLVHTGWCDVVAARTEINSFRAHLI